ncbi:hypothetical protein L0F63_003880 [Massospora cicadina]|nr:hypothetical protein L0F63_003880 [Massospora cicadina]
MPIQTSSLGNRALALDDKKTTESRSESKRKSSDRSFKSNSSLHSKTGCFEKSSVPKKEEAPKLSITVKEARPESMFSPPANNELSEAKLDSPVQSRASSYTSGFRAAPTDSDLEHGILSPTPNKDVAVKMSIKNGNSKVPPPAENLPKSLPSDLQSDINQFQINGFAQRFFSTHKKGLFRKKIPLETLLVWSADSLYQPLLVLQGHPADDGRPASHQGVTDAMELQRVVERGIFNSELRDEIYVQVCKQLTRNPSPTSVKLGWQILASIVLCFPPSKNFENYFKHFICQNQSTGNAEIGILSAYCWNKLQRICKAGPKGKVPSLADLEQAMEAPFNPSVFGENLQTIMERQIKTNPELKLPKVLPFLTDAVLQLRGDQSEGIFRVPGDMEQVASLRLRIDKNTYTLDDITDCNVPGSLLKFWLRDLEEPLIPAEFYTRCIKVAKDVKSATEVIESLPEFNCRVVKFVIQFLQVFAREESANKTKMSVQNLAMVFAPSFLRCPSDDLTEVFTNSKQEQEFLGILISNYHTEPQER